jgi:DNA-binding IscR family transcriptional regulator
MLDRLQQAGVIHRVECPAGSYSLARAPDDINADDLINLGFELSNLAKGAGAASVVERMRDAQRLLASKLTVASLVKSSETADQATTS